MRNSKNRQKIDTLYVLGAGASFSATRVQRDDAATVAPLDRDFCARITSLPTQKPIWVAESIVELQRYWKGHRRIEDFGLEAAIIRQLSHMRFFDAIHPRRRVSCTEGEYLNHVAHLVCFLLKKARESRSNAYGRLGTKIFPQTEKADQYRNRIVTFNYDDLIDRHLLKRFAPDRLYFDKIQRSKDEAQKNNRFEHPLLVKLHGSVNWRCKTENFEHIIDSTLNKDDESYWLEPIWHASRGNPAPDDSESPCIIPPLPDKPITRISLFSFLWTKAYEYLHEAREIVFCGYSLPDTDPLAMSLFGNFANRRLRRVTVVDADPSILAKWRDLLSRSNVSTARWEYHSDFTEYVDSLES